MRKFTIPILLALLMMAACDSSEKKAAENNIVTENTELKEEIITLDSVNAEMTEAAGDIDAAIEELEAELEDLDN